MKRDGNIMNFLYLTIHILMKLKISISLFVSDDKYFFLMIYMYSSQRKFSNNHIQMTIYMIREYHYVRQCVLLMVLEKSNQMLTVLASQHFRKPYPACKKICLFFISQQELWCYKVILQI